jgi:hypothetical protein
MNSYIKRATVPTPSAKVRNKKRPPKRRPLTKDYWLLLLSELGARGTLSDTLGATGVV